eukprot:gene14351-biopygen6187
MFPGAPRGSRLDPGGSRRRPLGSLGARRGPRGGPKGAQGAVELFTRRCVGLPYCLCFAGWAAWGATAIAARSRRIPKASAGIPGRPSWAAGGSQGRPGRRQAFHTALRRPAVLLVFRGLGSLGRHGDRGSIPEDPEGVRWDPWAAVVGRGGGPKGAQGAVELFTRRCVGLPYCLCFVGWAAWGATGIAARSRRIPKASAGIPWRPWWAAGWSQGLEGLKA